VTGATGACSRCGGPAVAPDLEREAQEVDRALSLEFGTLVTRWDWGARAPDGILDNVAGWLPAVRRRRQVWRRGQELWAARMTAERWSYCGTCAPPLPPEPAE
jgi:hypothetical protein